MTKGRYLTWEARGCWPGRDALAECLARLDSVRDRALSVDVLVDWLERGEDDPPLGTMSGPVHEAFANGGALDAAREAARRAAPLALVPTTREELASALAELTSAVLLLDRPPEEQMAQLNKVKWIPSAMIVSDLLSA